MWSCRDVSSWSSVLPFRRILPFRHASDANGLRKELIGIIGHSLQVGSCKLKSPHALQDMITR